MVLVLELEARAQEELRSCVVIYVHKIASVEDLLLELIRQVDGFKGQVNAIVQLERGRKVNVCG